MKRFTKKFRLLSQGLVPKAMAVSTAPAMKERKDGKGMSELDEYLQSGKVPSVFPCSRSPLALLSVRLSGHLLKKVRVWKDARLDLKCLQGGRAHPLAACEVATYNNIH